MDRAYPNLGLKGDWDLGEDNWKDDMDGNLLLLSVICQGKFAGYLAAEPGAPAEGDVVILDNTHATHPNAVAAYDEAAWHYFDPNEGWRLYNTAVPGFWSFTGGAWAADVVGLTTEQIQDMLATFLDQGSNITLTYDDAGNLLTIAAAGGAAPTLHYKYGSFAAASIAASEVLMDHIVTEAHTLAANFAGCRASVGSNPAATWTADVQKNGVSVGSLAISAAGVVTFATTGGAAVAMAAGDVLSLIAPAGADAAIARLRFTFQGTI